MAAVSDLDKKELRNERQGLSHAGQGKARAVPMCRAREGKARQVKDKLCLQQWHVLTAPARQGKTRQGKAGDKACISSKQPVLSH